MERETDILNLVRKSSAKRILILPHAVRQMSRPDRIISVAEVRQVIENGELIEDYPEYVQSHNCLILGYGESNRPIHIVCSPQLEYLAVTTAYLPSEQEWENNCKKRKNL